MGGIPLGLGMVMKINFLNLHTKLQCTSIKGGTILLYIVHVD